MVDRCCSGSTPLPTCPPPFHSTRHTPVHCPLSKALSTTHPNRRPGTRRRAPRCGSRPSRPARIHCGMHSRSTASSSRRQGTSDRPHRQRQAVAAAAAGGSATAAARARHQYTRACHQGTRRGTLGEWRHRSIPHSSIRSTPRIHRSRQYTTDRPCIGPAVAVARAAGGRRRAAAAGRAAAVATAVGVATAAMVVGVGGSLARRWCKHWGKCAR